MAQLVAAHVISEEEAFTHPMRNIVSRTVGGILEKDKQDRPIPFNWTFNTVPVLPGDIFIAASDGFIDNVPPEHWSFVRHKTVSEIMNFANEQARVSGVFNPQIFAQILADHAFGIMNESDPAEYQKSDDISVVVLQIPSSTEEPIAAQPMTQQPQQSQPVQGIAPVKSKICEV